MGLFSVVAIITGAVRTCAQVEGTGTCNRLSTIDAYNSRTLAGFNRPLDCARGDGVMCSGDSVMRSG